MKHIVQVKSAGTNFKWEYSASQNSKKEAEEYISALSKWCLPDPITHQYPEFRIRTQIHEKEKA